MSLKKIEVTNKNVFVKSNTIILNILHEMIVRVTAYKTHTKIIRSSSGNAVISDMIYQSVYHISCRYEYYRYNIQYSLFIVSGYYHTKKYIKCSFHAWYYLLSS